MILLYLLRLLLKNGQISQLSGAVHTKRSSGRISELVVLLDSFSVRSKVT